MTRLAIDAYGASVSPTMRMPRSAIQVAVPNNVCVDSSTTLFNDAVRDAATCTPDATSCIRVIA